MSGDAHVRICESLGVQFPRATRLYLKIDGRMVYLWRAVDAEGEVLDVLVQAKRNKRAALKLMRNHVIRHPPTKSRRAFLERIHDGEHREPGIDPEQVAKAVLALLAARLPAAEHENAKAATPEELHLST